MSEFLPKEVREGLELARKKDLRKKSRLRVHSDGKIYPILRYWESGFVLDIEDAPNMRGFVDIYDGSSHLYRCLVVASEKQGDEMTFDFKRSTLATDSAALDFEKTANAPVALIGR